MGALPFLVARCCEFVPEIFIIASILMFVQGHLAKGLDDGVIFCAEVLAVVFMAFTWTVTTTATSVLFPMLLIARIFLLLFKQLVFIVPLDTLPRKCIRQLLVLALLDK